MKRFTPCEKLSRNSCPAKLGRICLSFLQTPYVGAPPYFPSFPCIARFQPCGPFADTTEVSAFIRHRRHLAQISFRRAGIRHQSR